jgi:lipopolysaccharide transport system ATP-binding protein
VGIIGRNGAGKSTLLKILSRITEPTNGRVEIYGRVGSLLEVGTGFHPELTGRENIFLNGAILGMHRWEIERKFDEIVAFSELEKFLDTPVKRYSSGMYMRLAFAVAAHLEPEILIVDEVLAVGDLQFQKKCLGKMDDVAKQGRTILFVSHNMAAVENICHRGIVLGSGKVQFVGSQTGAITRYLSNLSASNVGSLLDRTDRMGSGGIRVTAIEIRDEQGNFLDIVTSGQTIDVYLRFSRDTEQKFNGIVASILFRTQHAAPVFVQHNRLTRDEFGNIPASGAFVCRIKRLPLPASTYRLDYNLLADNGNGELIDAITEAFELNVEGGDFYGTGEVPPIAHGVCLVQADWRLDTAS